MHLLLSQLVYTSFAGMGFRLLASAQVPTEIQQTFIERVAYQHWDSYAPPRSGYRAVYLHQVTPEHCLFGWLYNDGADDVGRSDVPYFICYYLAAPLHAVQLENIFTFLHNGPVALIDRHSTPTSLETMVVPDLWSYQPAYPGVAIPVGVRKRSHVALKQEELLELFVPVDEQKMVIELNAQTYSQQIAKLSIYTHYPVKSIETGAAAFYTHYLVEGIEIDAAALIEPIEARFARQRKAVQPLEKVALVIKSKDVAPVRALNEAVAVHADTCSLMGTVLLQILSTVQSLKISLQQADHNSVLAYKNSQLLLRVGIAVSVLALTASIYALVQTNIFAPKQPDVPSASSSVFFGILPPPTENRGMAEDSLSPYLPIPLSPWPSSLLGSPWKTRS